MSLHIRQIQGAAELQAVHQQRQAVHACELGFRPLPADSPFAQADAELDASGHLLGAFDGPRLVASVRVNYGDAALPHGGFGPYAQMYRMDRFGPLFPAQISVVTKLVAEPAWRNGTLMAQFGVALYTHTRDTQPQVMFCMIDCVPMLRAFFEQIGYRQIGAPLQHPAAGTVLPMAFAVYDQQHFMRVCSPLAAVCPWHDPASVDWFESNFAAELVED